MNYALLGLDKMMTPFPTIKIAELVKSGEANLQTGPFGTQLKASDYVDEGTPVINVRNIGFGDIKDANLEYLDNRMVEKLAAHKLQENDIVFGRKGAVERHGFISKNQKGWIQGSDCLRLRINSEHISNRFVSYYLQTSSHGEWMQAVCGFGATMASLNQDIVKLITLPLPPLPTQQKIAAILSAYDDLIENNQRRIVLLEKMAEEIYREWFVRMRFPGHEQVKFYKSVPEGWKIQKINTIANFVYGYTESACINEDMPKFLRVMDINKTSYINWSTVPNCSIADNDFEKYKLNKYDIVIARMADPGKVSIIERDINSVFASYLIKINYNKEKVTPYYFFYTLSSSYYLSYFSNADSGATRGSVNAQIIGGTEIILPTHELMKNFEFLLNSIRQKITVLNEKTEKLINIRNALLPRLISGKLSIDDLDIHFPPSMREESPATYNQSTANNT